MNSFRDFDGEEFGGDQWRQCNDLWRWLCENNDEDWSLCECRDSSHDRFFRLRLR